MPLQNRVTPFGTILALPGRGLLTGNRGILHDGRGQIARNWAARRWIACVLEFRGRHRPVMQPGRYTHLFFLDEAAALSAGHRPCAECRRADYKRFRELWEIGSGAPASADIMDATLHAERLNGRAKRTYRAGLSSLPDGTCIALDGEAWLVSDGDLLGWSGSGYRDRRTRPTSGDVEVLTPRSIVNVLSLGYRPEIHPSAHPQVP